MSAPLKDARSSKSPRFFFLLSLSLLEAPGVFVVAAVVLKERNGSLLEKFDLSRF